MEFTEKEKDILSQMISIMKDFISHNSMVLSNNNETITTSDLQTLSEKLGIDYWEV